MTVTETRRSYGAPRARSGGTVLPEAEWTRRAEVHRDRASRWTDAYRARRARGQSHPVVDFLFQYYRYSPAKLEAWHPAPGEALADTVTARERYATAPYAVRNGRVERDPEALTDREARWVRRAVAILQGIELRRPQFGCHGLHEWAMVYGGGHVRHDAVADLRLPQHEVDRVVEALPITCTHFDAFRFFAPDARSLNRVRPDAAGDYGLEQGGCVHANMDLYRWSYRAMPWVGSDALGDAFELALDLRELDMRASPYDLRALGYEAIAIETPDGRAEYQERQRELAARASSLRRALIDTLTGLLEARDPDFSGATP